MVQASEKELANSFRLHTDLARPEIGTLVPRSLSSATRLTAGRPKFGMSPSAESERSSPARQQKDAEQCLVQDGPPRPGAALAERAALRDRPQGQWYWEREGAALATPAAPRRARAGPASRQLRRGGREERSRRRGGAARGWSVRAVAFFPCPGAGRAGSVPADCPGEPRRQAPCCRR